MQLVRASSRVYVSNRRHLVVHATNRTFRLTLHTKASDVSTELSRTRNIGIIAHIDAVCHESNVTSACDVKTYQIQGQDDHHRAYALLQRPY